MGAAAARAARLDRGVRLLRGAALRLARFNANIDVVDKRYFQGLPSPAAAALVAGFVWIVDDFEIERVDWLRSRPVASRLFAGITMVTNVPFYSFKDINFRRSVPFWAILVIVLALILVSANPPDGAVRAVRGLLGVRATSVWLWNRRKPRPAA